MPTVLALLAHAFLSVLAAAQPAGNPAHDDLLIPLTRHEIRRLFTGIVPAAGTVGLCSAGGCGWRADRLWWAVRCPRRTSG